MAFVATAGVGARIVFSRLGNLCGSRTKFRERSKSQCFGSSRLCGCRMLKRSVTSPFWLKSLVFTWAKTFTRSGREATLVSHRRSFLHRATMPLLTCGGPPARVLGLCASVDLLRPVGTTPTWTVVRPKPTHVRPCVRSLKVRLCWNDKGWI